MVDPAGLADLAAVAVRAVKSKAVPFVYAVPLLDRENRSFYTLAGIVIVTPNPEIVTAEGQFIVPLRFGPARFADDVTGRPLSPATVYVLKSPAEINSELETCGARGLPVSLIGGFGLRLPEIVEDGFQLEQVPVPVTPDGFIEAAAAAHTHSASVTFRVSRDAAYRVLSVRAVTDELVDTELTPV